MPDARIGRMPGGDLIKTPRLHFHGLGGFLDGLQPQRPHQPDGSAIHKTAHVLPPDERHMVAKTGLVQFQQPVAMAVLLTAHLAEFRRLLGIVRLQTLGEILVDAGVLLFQRNGQREDFLLGQTFKRFHKNGENNRAVASRNLHGTVRASTSASVTPCAPCSFFPTMAAMACASSRP